MSPTSSKIANDTSHMVGITYGEPLLQQISYIFDSPIPCSTPELRSKVFVDLRRGLCPKPEDSKLGPSTLDRARRQQVGAIYFRQSPGDCNCNTGDRGSWGQAPTGTLLQGRLAMGSEI